jgi:hypothetical protein
VSPLARCIRDKRTVAVEKEVIGRSGGGRLAKMGRVTVRSVLLDALACVSSGKVTGQLATTRGLVGRKTIYLGEHRSSAEEALAGLGGWRKTRWADFVSPLRRMGPEKGRVPSRMRTILLLRHGKHREVRRG